MIQTKAIYMSSSPSVHESDSLFPPPGLPAGSEFGFVALEAGKLEVESPVLQLGNGLVSKGEDRVALRGLEADPRFFIRKMEIPKDESSIKKIWRSFFWVRVTESNGKEVYYNIRSIASRCGMEHSDIKEAAAKGDTFAMTLTQNAIKARDTAKGTRILFLNRLGSSSLTPKEKENLALFVSSDEHRGDLAEGVEVEVSSGKWFLVKKAEAGKVHVIDLVVKEEIASGSFGTVHKVRDIVSGEDFAMKVGKGVRVEAQNLREVQERGITGSQPPPHIVTYIRDDSGRKHEAMVGKLYALPGHKAPDASSWIKSNPPASKRMAFIKQLWVPFQQMQKAGIVHNDLKPANILGHMVDEELEFHIGDWAGKQDLNKGKAEPVICTPEYTQLQAASVLADPLASRASKKVAALAHDRFSMGCIFFEVLTGGKHPYAHGEDRYPIPGSYNEEALKDYSPKCQEFLREMLSLDIPDSKEEFEAQQKKLDGMYNELVASGQLMPEGI